MAKVANFRAMRTRLGDRLARSSRVFLLGLIIACGVEVLVDWNQTFFEINGLRDQIRQKSFNYAGLVQHVIGDDLEKHELVETKRLAGAILGDDDACFMRVTDASGSVLFEQTRDGYDAIAVSRGLGPTFRDHYSHFMQRDIEGVLKDPDEFQRKLANSRYRDLPQLWSDFTAYLAGFVVTPPPKKKAGSLLVYQDRIRTEDHVKDDRTTWGIGSITNAKGEQVGAVLVAFDMDRTNKAVRTKYLKGFGIVIFFIALILVQNTLARRDKLRLLDLDERYKNAKDALKDALPKGTVDTGALVIDGALDQAQGPVDGMVFDIAKDDDGAHVLIVDPDGDGIDAAAIGLHMLKVFRARRKEGVKATLQAEIAALGAATEDIPLTRPIGVLLLRASNDGVFESVQGDRASLLVLDGTNVAPVDTISIEDDVPAGVVGPLSRSKGAISSGATLLVTMGGPDTGPFAQARKKKDVRLDASGLAKFVVRSKSVADAAVWARGKTGGMNEDDIVIVTIARTPDRSG